MTRDPELLQEFIAESAEHLALVQEDIIALERDATAAAPETVNHLFRSLHTIKGGAGLMEFARLTELAHALESVIGRMRDRTLVPDSAVTEALLRGIDRLAVLLGNIENESLPIENEVAALKECLQPATGNNAATPPAAAPAPAPAAAATPAPEAAAEAEVERDPELVAEFISEAAEHLATVEDDVLALERDGAKVNVDTVNHLFRALHTVKGGAGLLEYNRVNKLAHALESIVGLIRGGTLVPSRVTSEVLLRGIDKLKLLVADLGNLSLNTDEEVAAVQAVLAGDVPPPRDTAPSTPPPPAARQPSAPPEPPTRDVPPPQDTAPALPQPPAVRWSPPLAAGAPPPGPAGPPPRGSRPAPAANVAPARDTSDKAGGDHTVRISLPLLDKLMNLASELVLVRNQNVQALAARDFEQLSTTNQKLNIVTSELQAGVMQTRMRPVGMILTKFTRIVRDLAHKLGKEVDLQIVGADVELDKTIIEAIGDPLTHLIRNAVDHGIELPADRKRAGKSPVGSVCLSAFHQAGQINIQIRDDGKGMDPAVLKAAGVRKGIIRADQAETMTDREAFSLVFEPGFSTAAAVTDVSGRGVGMDVVRASFQKLGGTVDIASVVGKGTTMTIRLPLTLAIVPTLIVAVSDYRFAIPQINIDEVVWLRTIEGPGGIRNVDEREVYWLRSKMLPMLRLSSVLNIVPEAGATRPESAYIIVLKLGNERFGLLVDTLVDTEEIVVKALHDQLKDCRAFSGTTVLGDGRIAMILDIAAIAELGKLRFISAENTVRTLRRSEEEQRTVLLFDLGGPERFSVPLCLITRVEQVQPHQIQVAHEREYLDFRGMIIPLVRLEQTVPRIHGNYREGPLYVLIPKCRRTFGVLVANVLDTVDVESQIDATTIRHPGIVGSQLVNGRLTLLVDVFSTIEHLEPDWFANEASTRPKQVLLVDDSPFVQMLISSYFRDSAVKMTPAENGQVGLSKLDAGSFDAVISDIHMPLMDGYAFARAVRGRRQFAHLPLVAVSSDESQTRALALDAGFDEFKSKLDRQGLVETVLRRCTNDGRLPQGDSHGG